MAFTPDYRTWSGAPSVAGTQAIDAGLRAYMLRVYNWMASGLLVTGIVAYGIANTTLINAFYEPSLNGIGFHPTGLAYLAMLAPLAFVLVLSFGVNKLSTQAAQAIYWTFCAAMGASLTSIFITYASTSIVRTFFITAGTFAAMSAWGYVTKTDLTKFGSFLMMGLIGIIIASLVNMFLGSAGLQFVISVIGVLVFVGLTAYDTQRIKSTYTQYAFADGPDQAGKRSVMDALSLYLNFINLFMLILQLTGTRRD
jgi:FtsH-binding integral membrane protein